MTARGEIVAEARSWLGTPFAHGQALKYVGCDCIGLLVGVADQLGMPEAARWKQDGRFKGYAPMPDPAKLLAACEEYLYEIQLGDATPGDILLFSFQRDPMHFAILSQRSPDYVIHGYQRVGRVVENGAAATFWRLLRAFSFRSAT